LKAGVRTETATRVFETIEITGIVEITEVIIGIVEIGAAKGIGLAASSSCAKHSKTVS
jgi:hypothetical protein